MFIPSDFTAHMLEIYGEAGRDWLARLPAILADCAARWQLKLERPFPLSYNYVAPATRADGTPVVLKVGYPNPELLSEMAALRVYNGRGVCRLLAADEAQGAFLLERVLPGVTLDTLPDDDEATVIAAQVMQQLWQPVPHNHAFPSLARWTEALLRLRPHFGGGTGPFPARLVDTAVALRAELLADDVPPVLLHGDFHHYNVLTAQRQPWLAIDPKGVVGDSAYEPSTLLYNPVYTFPYRPDMPRRLRRRLDILADVLDIDRARLLRWGIVQNVLSVWWSVEDNESGWEPVLRIGEALLEEMVG
ncbi:MAG: phosphotransferase [Ardenticatenaceae bacterium]|nr:phosphotransferase [Ardenticatenaceae bacterium]MCB8986392.1 phosphotransferase [Ardenticatenaceae bacterium]